MKSILESEYAKNLQKGVLKSRGFKIAESDLQIINKIVQENTKELLQISPRSRSNAKFVNFLLEKKYGNAVNETTVVDDDVFNELAEKNVLLRANVGERFDVNFFANTPLYVADGDNGSGLYFCENETDYVKNHFKKFSNTLEKVGNVWKMVVNPNASLIDRITLYQTQQKLIENVNRGFYDDGSKCEFNGNKNALINFLQCDVSVVAVLMGAQIIYVPFKHLSQGKSSGDAIVLDKSAVMLSNKIYRCNAKVDLSNLDSANEQSKIDALLNNKNK